MSDKKIDEIRREHFGVSDDEAMSANEVSSSLQSAMERVPSTPINPPPSFSEEFMKKATRVLAASSRRRFPVMSSFRQPKPGCYKDVDATEPCTEPGDPVGAVVYEGAPLTQEDEAKRPTFTGKVTLDLEGTPFEGSDMDGAEVDTSITECFGCGMPTQRTGLFAEADVRCNECADKHQSQQREQQRTQLVDGWPGDWRSGEEWGDDAWRLPVKEGVGEVVYAKVYKTSDFVRARNHRWGGVLCIQSREDVDIGDSRVFGERPYDVARKLRPHGEALKVCLEAMRDE